MDIKEIFGRVGDLLRRRDFEGARQALAELDGAKLSDRGRILLLNSRSTALRETGHADQAAADCAELATLIEKVYGEGRILAGVLHNYAMTLDMLGRFEEAIAPATRGLAILRRELPAGSIEIANAVLALAKHHYELGRFDQAQEMLEEAMQTYTADGNRRNLGVSACLNNMGRILEHKGHGEEALPLFEEAADIRMELLGSHPDTAFTLLNYGTCLAANKKYLDASTVLMKARDMYSELGMTGSPYYQACLDNLSVCSTSLARTRCCCCGS